MRPSRLAVLTLLLAAPAFAQPSRPAEPGNTVSEVVVAPCRHAGGADTVALPGHPFLAAASGDGCWLFVGLGARDGGASASDGGVAVLHNEGGRFVFKRLLPLGDSPGGVMLSHDGVTLVAGTLASVALFDVAKLEAGEADAAIAVLPARGGVAGMAIGRDDRLLFLSSYEGTQVTEMDFAAARAGRRVVRQVIGVGEGPVGLAFSPDGSRLYSTSLVGSAKTFPNTCQGEGGGGGPTHPEGFLLALDVAALDGDPAKAAVGVRRAGCSPFAVAPSPDGGLVWVTARGEGRLLAFDAGKLGGPVQARPELSVRVGAAPSSVAVRPDGRQIWVANSNRFNGGQGSLTEVSPEGQVLRTLPAGRFPRGLGFLPDGKTLVVAQFGSKALQFVPTDGP